MKKTDIKIGGQYIAKVSGKLVPVQILRESVYGGWDGKNTVTGREVRNQNCWQAAARCWRDCFHSEVLKVRRSLQQSLSAV